MNRPIYAAMAEAITAYQNCVAKGNELWANRWLDRLKQLENLLPVGSGSGFFDVHLFALYRFKEEIRIDLSYLFTDEHGVYDGYRDYQVVIKPSLFLGVKLTVKGRDRNDIKTYIRDVYYQALTSESPDYPWE